MTVTRRIDDLGRIVIPKEMREAMRINGGEAFDITTTRDGKIIIEKTKTASFDDEVTVNIPNDRKMCVMEYDNDVKDIVLLTDDQIKLLDWLYEKDYFNGYLNYYQYNQEFEVI